MSWAGGVPALRFPEFSEEWKNKPLSDFIVSMNAGVSVNSGDRPAQRHEYGILKTSCVTNGLFDPQENKVVLDYNEISRLREPVKAGTIIISRMNTPALVGANALVLYDRDNLFLPDRLWAAKVKPDTSAYWLGLVMAHQRTRQKLSDLASGTSGSMKNISKCDVKAMRLLAPTLPEQQKIADFLGAVDARVRLLRRRRDALRAYKKGTTHRLFTRDLRFTQAYGSPFPGWQEKRLGEVFDRVTRKNAEDNQNVMTISAQQGLINQQEFFNKSVSANDVSGYYLLHRDDFAYNKSYSKGYPMGAIKRLRRYDKGVVSTLYICFAAKSTECIGFFEQFFDYGGLNRELLKIAQEGARNHGLLNISVVEFFRDIRVPYPHPTEQQKIADALTALDAKIDAVTAQIDAMARFKKGLLQQMFA